MKINCHVDPSISEEHGELWIKKMTPAINELLQKLTKSENSLWCHYQSQIYPINFEDIYSLEVANRDIKIYTEKQ